MVAAFSSSSSWCKFGRDSRTQEDAAGGHSGLSSPPRSPGALQGVAADRILQLGAPVTADPSKVDVGTLAIAPDIEPAQSSRRRSQGAEHLPYKQTVLEGGGKILSSGL